MVFNSADQDQIIDRIRLRGQICETMRSNLAEPVYDSLDAYNLHRMFALLPESYFDRED